MASELDELSPFYFEDGVEVLTNSWDQCGKTNRFLKTSGNRWFCLFMRMVMIVHVKITGISLVSTGSKLFASSILR